MKTWTYDLTWAPDKWEPGYALHLGDDSVICGGWANRLFGDQADRDKTIRATLGSENNGGLHLDFSNSQVSPLVNGVHTTVYDEVSCALYHLRHNDGVTEVWVTFEEIA